jgi:putative transposase
MKYDPDKHHRRSIRLRGYDYATPGAYFVTICTQNRTCLFGDVLEDTIRLNDAGQMVRASWEQLPQRFPVLELDAYIVMPNHFHAIAMLIDISSLDASGSLEVAQCMRSASRRGTQGLPTLGDMLGAFKSLTVGEYIRGVKQLGWTPFERRLWQYNYWEHIIRSEPELNQIRDYIQTNPACWISDQLHPDVLPNHFNQV